MPTDALLIQHIEYPAAANGYYALLLDEDGKALRNHTVPYQLEPFTVAGINNFAFNLPGDAEQPWRFWAKILCANMNLPNNPYGCYYRLYVFARAAVGVNNPAADTLKYHRRLLWLQREVDARLDPFQEQIMSVLASQAVYAADKDENSIVPGGFGEFFELLPSLIIDGLLPDLLIVKNKVVLQPAELAGARYQVKLSAAYDDQTSRLGMVAWLDKDGQIFPDVAAISVVVKDSGDEEVASLNGLIVGSSGQFNVSANALELSPDEVYFITATITTAEEPPRIFTSAISLTTWD